MHSEAKLRALCERVFTSTSATLKRKALPVSAHQAAADLYDAIDSYTDAISKNQLLAARAAAEKLAVEAMRVLWSYEANSVPPQVDSVKVESAIKHRVDA